MNKRSEIIIRVKAEPEAFVMKYLVLNYGFGYRPKVPSFYDTTGKTWRIPVILVVPQQCRCCGGPKPAKFKNAGEIMVRRKDEADYEIVEDKVAFSKKRED